MQIEASYEDGSFLSFKALSRENLRLSPQFVHNHLWTGPTRLFTLSNTLGWAATGTDDTLNLSPLSELRGAFKAPREPLQSRVSIPLSLKPISLTFANNDTCIVVAHLNGVMSVYDTSPLRNPSFTGSLNLVHTFTHSSEPVRDLQPNPSDKPDVIAVLRGSISSGTRVEMISVSPASASLVSTWDIRGSTNAQICLAWSPKGKQISVGDVTGDLTQYTPDGVIKSTIKAPSDRPNWLVTSVTWLENTLFYVTYASPGMPADEQEFQCYAIQTDKVGGTPTYIMTPDASPPFGDRSREGARFFLGLRDWSPMKHILIVADPPSTDIGVIAQHGDRPSLDWAALELEETDRVILPMDNDGRDTYPVGVDIDLTSTDAVSLATHGGDETPPAPPSPILYVYTNTGDLAAYHILNSKQPSYPGMIATIATPVSAAQVDTGSMEMATTPTIEKPAPMAAAFGQPTSPGTSSASPFAQPGFGAFGNSNKPGGAFGSGTFGTSGGGGAATSSFGAGSAFGSSAFGNPSASSAVSGTFGAPTPSSAPVFGQSSFGQSAFGQPSAFGTPFKPAPISPTPQAGSGFSAFAAPSTGSGFASFAKPAGTSGFGAIVSSSNALEAPRPSSGMEVSPVTPQEESKPGLPTAPVSAFGTSPGSSEPSAFAAKGGFGAFGSSAFGSGTSAFARAAQESSAPVAPAFGATDVTKKPSPPLGGFQNTQSSSASPFGKSSFFGQATTPPEASSTSPPATAASPPASSTSPPPSTSSAFASKGFLGSNIGSGTSAFAKAAQSGTTTPTPNAFSAFATSGGGFSAPASGTSTPTFGQPSMPNAKPVFGSTSFGGTFGAAPTFVSTQVVTPKPVTPTAAPVNGGFAAFASGGGGGGFTSAFSKIDTSKSAFGPTTPESEASKSTSIFGAAKKIGTTTTPTALRSQSADDDDAETTSSMKPGRFDEDVIANREPETIDSGSMGSMFASAQSSAERLADTKKASSTSGSGAMSFDALDEALRLSVPASSPLPASPVTPERPRPSTDAAQLGTTTPEGSPTKFEDTPASVSTSPPTVAPRGPSASPPPSMPASSSSSLGIGRPPSAPRLSVPAASFTSAPTRSSPLAATPPINRKDVSDSPSPPKPIRQAGGIFAKTDPDEDEEGEEELEEFLKSRSKPALGVGKALAKPKFPAVVTPSKDEKATQQQRTPSASPPAASVPISDTPKTLQRVKTPPLLGFGLGAGGAKKPSPPPSVPHSTPAPAPTSTPNFVTKPTSSPFSPSPSTGVPAIPNPFGQVSFPPGNLFSGSTFPTPSASKLQTPAPVRPPVPAFPASSSAGLPMQSNLKKETIPAPPPENQKPTINGQVDKIVYIMEKELEQLRDIAKQCNDQQISIVQSKRQGDARFREVDRWGLGDLKALRRQTDDLEDDTLKLEDESLALKTQIAELQSLRLKAETSKQEIERLLRAREDKSFAKLLKVRALGPEHLENQTRLRHSIQLANDRVLQLEEQVAAMKKRVQIAKSGENPLKAPSLDTIARAISNIEAGALEKRNQMNALTERLEALDLSLEESESEDSEDENSDTLPPPPPITPSSRRKLREQTPLDEILARPTLTPKIKSVSANALNAERAGLRLKSALLTIRSRPLLNTQAVPQPVDPAKLEQGFTVSLATIQLPLKSAKAKPDPKAQSSDQGKSISFTAVANANSPFGAGKFGNGAVLNFKIPDKVDLPTWDIPSEGDMDQFDDSTRRRGGMRGGGSGRARHSQSVRLNSHSPAGSPDPQKVQTSAPATGSPPVAAAAPKFDWGFGDLAKSQNTPTTPPGFVSLLNYQPSPPSANTNTNKATTAPTMLPASAAVPIASTSNSSFFSSIPKPSSTIASPSPFGPSSALSSPPVFPPPGANPLPFALSSSPFGAPAGGAIDSPFSKPGLFSSGSFSLPTKPSDSQSSPATTSSPFANNSIFGGAPPVSGASLASRLTPPTQRQAPDNDEPASQGGPSQKFLAALAEEGEDDDDDDDEEEEEEEDEEEDEDEDEEESENDESQDLERELADALEGGGFDEEGTDHGEDGPWEGSEDWDEGGDASGGED